MIPRRITRRLRKLPTRTTPFVASLFANLSLAAAVIALATDGTETLRSFSSDDWLLLTEGAAAIAAAVLILIAPGTPSASSSAGRSFGHRRIAYARLAIPTILGLSLAVFGLTQLRASNTLWYEELTLKAAAETAEWTPTSEPEQEQANSFTAEKAAETSTSGSPAPSTEDNDQGTTSEKPAATATSEGPSADGAGPTEVDPRPEPAESDPHLIVGPSSCRDIETRFGASWHEARLDGGDLVAGTFGPTSQGFEVTIENLGDRTFDWWSEDPVAAIIVKAAGGDSLVYPYDQDARRGLSLTVPSATRAIDHISFCMEPLVTAEPPDPEPSDDQEADSEASTSQSGGSGGSIESIASADGRDERAGHGSDGIAFIDMSPQPTPSFHRKPGFLPGDD